MKPLIKTVEHNGNTSVSARNLYQFLEVKTQFKDWIRRRIDDYGFIENQDFEVSLIFEQNSKGGRPTKEYILSMDMAKELSMIERSEKGKQARLYFIECEKKLRQVQPNYFAIEVSSERITEKRQILYKQFTQELRKFLYRGDLTKLAQEYGFSYSKVIRVMRGLCFDNEIVNILYEKAMNNKYSLECQMEVMITELKA